MRYASLLLVASIPMFFAACGGGGAGDEVDGAGGADGDATDEDGATGGRSSGGGSGLDMVFTDLPGKVRFANFVSDGTAGVNLDFYWGVTFEDSELIGTVEYGEVTEFLVPRHADFALLDPDEARYFAVLEGHDTELPSQFLANNDEHFAAETRLTVAFAGVENFSGDALVLGVQNFYEHNLSEPPAGNAHVYVWSSPFDQITDGDFVLAGADDLCLPEHGVDGLSNIGYPALIPEGSTGVTLFDANTEPACNSGLEPITEPLVAGHSYVLIGEAETFELEARHVVLLEVGLEN